VRPGKNPYVLITTFGSRLRICVFSSIKVYNDSGS